MESHRRDSEQLMGFKISFLHQLPSDQPSLYGGKATNLAQLHRYGVLIPRGFVIPIQAFTSFISTCKQIKSYEEMQLGQNDIEGLLQSAERFRNNAIQYEISQPVTKEIIKGLNQLSTQQNVGKTGYAVRSSATAEDTEHFSFAGQADSFLCVRDPLGVIEAVKQTWLSLYSPRALIYLHARGLKVDQIYMGVIIQEMILGDISGVMFTANVVNHNPNQLIIDSTWGLGESIVAGKVTPDSFVVQKSPLKIIDRQLGEKAFYSAPHPRKKPDCTVFKETPLVKQEMFSLTDNKLYELAHLGVRNRTQNGFPSRHRVDL